MWTQISADNPSYSFQQKWTFKWRNVFIIPEIAKLMLINLYFWNWESVNCCISVNGLVKQVFSSVHHDSSVTRFQGHIFILKGNSRYWARLRFMNTYLIFSVSTLIEVDIIITFSWRGIKTLYTFFNTEVVVVFPEVKLFLILEQNVWTIITKLFSGTQSFGNNFLSLVIENNLTRASVRYSWPWLIVHMLIPIWAKINLVNHNVLNKRFLPIID